MMIRTSPRFYSQELILKRDPRLSAILGAFDSDDSQDAKFLNTINNMIGG